jgi:two-component system KDP operon response regulator KdpE
MTVAMAPQPLHVLIIEDDANVRVALEQALTSFSVTVLAATTGMDGIAMASSNALDAIVLDLGLPDIDGESVCRAIRSVSSVPIIVLSAQHEESEKVALLDAGADDYVTKPFSNAELLARLRAHARRHQERSMNAVPSTLRLDDVELDLHHRVATRAGLAIRLTPTEWTLLRVLVAQRGRTMTHRQLFAAVWNRTFGDASLHLRVHITHLRRKLEANPAVPRFFVTDPGVGYRFELPADADLVAERAREERG